LALGQAGVPSFKSLDRLTSSFDRTGGIEKLMGVLFYGTAATNGFDSIGHYIRTEALVGGCTAYVKTPVGGCSANFSHTRVARDVTSAVLRARASGIQPARTAAVSGLLHYLIGNGP
jgi:hypothetical protein